MYIETVPNRNSRPAYLLRDAKRVGGKVVKRTLDGIYVIRTSEPAGRLSAADAVRAYKSLGNVEKSFRTFKGVDILVRPNLRRRGPDAIPSRRPNPRRRRSARRPPGSRGTASRSTAGAESSPPSERCAAPP